MDFHCILEFLKLTTIYLRFGRHISKRSEHEKERREEEEKRKREEDERRLEQERIRRK